jgi:hypothetical protein
LVQQLAEVNTQIDAVTDDAKRDKLVAISPPDWTHLFRYLRALHLDAGEPSSRKVAASSGGMISHTTVSMVLAGARVPSWKSLLVIGNELGADEDALKRIWVHCQMQVATPDEGAPASLLAGTIRATRK